MSAQVWHQICGLLCPRVSSSLYHLHRIPSKDATSGGLLTGKLLENGQPEPGSHFDPNTRYAGMYNERFGHASQAIKDIKTAADNHGLHLSDVAYRWVEHHSAMVPCDHGIIIGGSNTAQVEKAVAEWCV